MSNKNMYNFSTGDEDKRTQNKKLLIVIRILFVISWMVLPVIIIKETFLLYQFCVNWDPPYRVLAVVVWFLGVFLSISLWAALVNGMYYRVSLRVYGLSQKSELWIIDFQDEAVVKAKIVSVTENYNGWKFDCANFDCIVRENGKKYKGHLPGRDIYFSERDAINVLDYLKEVNNEVLKQYYPKWEQDDDFVSYYRKCQLNRFHQDQGIGNVTDISVYTLTPVTINKNIYEPIPFFKCDIGGGVQDMMQCYITHKDHELAREKEIIQNKLMNYSND